MRHHLLLLFLLAGCSGPLSDGSDGSDEPRISQGALAASASQLVVLGGARLPDGPPVDVYILDRQILAVRAVGTRPSGAHVIDVRGQWIAPAFIDSHVHLVYRPDARGMLEGGVAAVVDQAAPIPFFTHSWGALDVIGAGPMVTAVDGYPTQSWGSDGYGWEVADPGQAIDAVDALYGLGAGLIKMPVTQGPHLAAGTMGVVVDRAHQHGLLVSTHALSDAEALAAGVAGADVLAHTPVGVLSDDTIIMWSSRAVISSLKAFGGNQSAIDNLQKLVEAGATVLYGTDFGNTTTAGIDVKELELMMEAGMTGAEILAAGTSAPANLWGFEDLGEIAPGESASLLILDEDPTLQPLTLAEPAMVFQRGTRLR
ncbi:MAG: imidazolonepropionase-like amidohydrolase [Myxococcota bacterium]|jgi:imidazolonepropionase-like amidohydrolase